MSVDNLRHDSKMENGWKQWKTLTFCNVDANVFFKEAGLIYE